MAKKKQTNEQIEQVEQTESVESVEQAPAPEAPKAGGWKAVVNVIVGKGVQLKIGDEVPSNLSDKEMEGLIADKMIVKG